MLTGKTAHLLHDQCNLHLGIHINVTVAPVTYFKYFANQSHATILQHHSLTICGFLRKRWKNTTKSLGYSFGLHTPKTPFWCDLLGSRITIQIQRHHPTWGGPKDSNIPVPDTLRPPQMLFVKTPTGQSSLRSTDLKKGIVMLWLTGMYFHVAVNNHVQCKGSRIRVNLYKERNNSGVC